MVIVSNIAFSPYKISSGGLCKLSWIKSQEGVFNISETSIWLDDVGNSVALITGTKINDISWHSINNETMARQYIKRSLFVEDLW